MNKALLQVLQDEEFVKKLAACANREEAQALLQAQGLAIGPEELEAALDELAPADGELNEDELDRVAGGCSHLVTSPWSQPQGIDCHCDGMTGRVDPSEFAPPEISVPVPDPVHKR